LSIHAILRTHAQIDQDALAESFIAHYDRRRGYGRGMRALIARMQKGQHWCDISRNFYGGQGSYGNGGAVRVAPIGAYFADDISALVANARASAEITHAHPEGIAGAIAVALAAGIAYQTRDDSAMTPHQLIERVIEHIPASEVRQRCVDAVNLPPDATPSQAAERLGSGIDMSAQRTVPFAIWCAAAFRHDFEDAIWQGLSAGGDTDTTCAMIGGIVALVVGQAGIPPAWIKQREALPAWAFA
jgi:ADP-ribosylglycohydrolase